jgi:tetratricopeptide (TPR) repeat protein
MKKPLVTMLLMLATAALQPLAAQQSSPAASPSGAAAPQQQPQQKKEIKDPAEYNAYVNAVQQSQPAAKATALESFLQTYPNSVMKSDAMELLMGSYQQAGNQQKTIETANRILQADPKNVRALALLAYSARATAEGGNASAIPQAAQYGKQGLEAMPSFQKPEGVSDADFDKQKQQLTSIFAGAAGFAALQQKNYAEAATDLKQAVAAEDAMKQPETPQTNAMLLRDMYPLAVAELEQNPMNPEGLWFAARAIKLAAGNPQAQSAIEKYGHAKYVKFHGSEQGWAELQAAATTNMPPQGFTVAPAPPPPTPAQQAADLINSKQVKDMSFAEWQLILSSGNEAAATKVWDTIHDKQIELVAFVISATRNQLMLAGSTDDNDAKKADITLNLATPLPLSKVPKEGATVQFQGAPDTYTPNPFMMIMKDGALAGASAATPAHHTTTPRKKPSR